MSFDDSQGSQGLPQLSQRDMTATFFCMTVVLDKPDWSSRDDLRRLADADMTVAAHTYDHNRADRCSGQDWKLQFDGPRELLETVIRRPDEPLDPTTPQLTLRCILVDSTWTSDELLQQVRRPT